MVGLGQKSISGLIIVSDNLMVASFILLLCSLS